MKINDNLEILGLLLHEKKAPVLNFLNPGESKDTIMGFFRDNNIRFNEDLVELYEWHNGTSNIYGISDSIIEIIPFGKFFNLSDLIRTRQLNIDWEVIDNAENFIPILGSGESEMYLVDNTSQVVCYLSPGANIYCEPYFISIAAFFNFIIKCYQENIITINSKSGLDYNCEAYGKLLNEYKDEIKK